MRHEVHVRDQPAAPSIASGSVYVSLQTIIQNLILLLYYLAIARLLTQPEIGQISLLNLAMGVFALMTMLAIPAASTKYIADSLGRNNLQEASAVRGASLRIILATSTPALIAALALSPTLAVYLFGTDSTPDVLMLTFGTAFIANLSGLFSSQLLGLGAFGFVALQGILYFLTSRSVGVSLAYFGFGVKGVATGWLLGALAGLAVARIGLRGRFVRSSGNFPVRSLLTFSFPIFLSQLIGTVQSWADLAILYWLTANLSDLGVYFLVVSGLSVLAILYSPISTATFPSVAFDYGRGDHESVNRKIHQTTRLVTIAVLPVSFSLAAVSQTALTIVFGRAYLTGTIPFILLATASVLPALGFLYSSILQGVGETKAIAKAGGAAAIIELAAALVLVPQIGTVGASLARVLMYATMFTLIYRALKARTGFRLQTSYLPSLLVLTALLAVPLAIIDWEITQLPTLQKFLLIATTFLALTILGNRTLHILTTNDLNQIASAMPKPLGNLLRGFGRLLVG